MKAAPGITFSLDDPIFGPNTVYLLTKFNSRQSDGLVDISGVLMPPWLIDDMNSESAADEVVPIQTHLMVIDDAVSETDADLITCFNWARIDDAMSDTAADDNVILIQTHLMVIEETASDTAADEAPLGLAWEHDIFGSDIQPAGGIVGSTGWFEDDTSSDLEPRIALAGGDTIWETDAGGDLQPV
ncbi:MAG: hypothetical protein AB9873_08090 [Syntrophobacteraceae bacterium]